MEYWLVFVIALGVLLTIVVFLYCIYRCYCKKDSRRCKRKHKYSRLPQDIESGLKNDGEHSFCQSEDNEQVSKPEVNHSQEIKLRDLQISKECYHVNNSNSLCALVENDEGQPPVTPNYVRQNLTHVESGVNVEFTHNCHVEPNSEESTAPVFVGTFAQGVHYPEFSSNFFNKKRSLTSLPDNFRTFINDTIIPAFMNQRATGYQFAVLMLLSEDNLRDIAKTVFTPNHMGRPIVNKDHPSMPSDRASYGNYIVARPVNNSYHSEEEIFGMYSSTNSPFIELWNSYVSRNGTSPKCILLYSWNLPCSRCTDVIIRSLEEQPYNTTSVIVAHTTYWKWSESESVLRQNIEKLKKKNVSVHHVTYPANLPPA